MSAPPAANPLVVALRGELCMVESPGIRRRIDAAVAEGARDVVIDLGQVTLLTAAALRELGTAARRLEGIGGSLRVRNPLPLAQKVLEITGFDRLLEPCLAA